MATMDPAVALSTAERALRQLMEAVFEHAFGAAWLHHVASPADLAKWTDRAEVERKKRGTRGVITVSEKPLDYAEFYELRNIAEKHWQHLAPALGERRVTGSLLARLDDLRNTVAHSREVLPFEADLLSGIAGELRNRVTIYMSTQGPEGDYYARVESVTDSFGNVFDGRETLQASNPHLLTRQTLSVGDVLTFECRATDPQGRSITWSYALLPGKGAVFGGITGRDARLQWVVGEESVGERSWIQIRMVSDGRFHRWPEGWDGFIAFGYRVRPPL